MNAIQLALEHAQRRLLERLAQLEARIANGEEAAWPEYRDLAMALAAVAAQLAPERSGRLVTTGELAAKMGLSSKTVLRKRKRGELGGAVVFGQRGRGAIRWNAAEVVGR